MPELSFWLDDYNDIYSDFDSRHYLKRRISEDFIEELRLAFRQNDGPSNDMILLLPDKKRKENTEKLIVGGLKDHFSNQYHIHNNHRNKTLRKNLLFFCTGFFCMAASILVSYSAPASFGYAILRILLEPAGWFFLWSSLDFLFYDFPSLTKEKKFYKELARHNIHFRSA